MIDLLEKSNDEFDSQIGKLQDEINNISAPDLSGYLKKDVADSLYVSKTDFDSLKKDVEELKKRVSALEQLSDNGERN